MSAITQEHTNLSSRLGSEERFFLIISVIMVMTVVAGFLTLYLRGISTFAAPFPVHAHAVLFMGWVGFFMLQVWCATTGRVHMHKRLGWIATVYVPVLVVVGALILLRMMRNAAVPPFWTYSYFMVMNLMSLIAFAGLTIVAIVLRKKTRWHRRLMLSGMAALAITAVNRLTPDSVLAQYMSLGSALAILLVPLAGMAADWRRDRHVHPAWTWGLAVLILTGLTTELVGRMPVAGEVVANITAGSPGARVDPFAQHLPPR